MGIRYLDESQPSKTSGRIRYLDDKPNPPEAPKQQEPDSLESYLKDQATLMPMTGGASLLWDKERRNIGLKTVNFLNTGLMKSLTGKGFQDIAQDATAQDIPQSQSAPFDSGLEKASNPIAQALGIGKQTLAGTAGSIADDATSPVGLAAPVGEAMGAAVGKPVANAFSKLKAPFDESKLIQGQLNNLKTEIGLPDNSTTGYVGKTIADKQKDILANKAEQIKSVKNYVDTTVNDIKQQKTDFDKNVLNSKATDFAKYMKDEGVNWSRKGSQKYGEGIDKISSLIDDATPITSEETANFFGNIIVNAESQGINSPMVGYLKQLNQKYTDMAAKGVMDNGMTLPVNFGTLKAEISGVNKYLSPGFKSGKYIEGGDRLSGITKGEWLDFMGKYMPEEGVEAYSKLQKNYKQFAQAKRTIGNMFHPYSGEFDLTAGINSAKKMALDKVNEGTENLMNVMEKGIPDFLPGMSGFKDKAQELVKAGQEKKILEMFPGLIKQSGKLATTKAETVAAEQMKQITAWRKKYDELVELEKRNQDAKDQIFNILKKTGIGIGVLAGGKFGVDKVKQLAGE